MSVKRLRAERQNNVTLFDEDEEQQHPFKKTRTLHQKVRVKLTPEDLTEIIRIATERHTRNLAAQVKERKSVNRDGLVLGIQGLVGEWLLYKLFQIDTAPLYDTTPRNWQKDNARDARLEGKKIEVKTTYSHNFGIRVEAREAKKPADYYALVTSVREQRDAPYTPKETIDCVFHGFVRAEDLLRPENLRKWGDGKQYYCLGNEYFEERIAVPIN